MCVVGLKSRLKCPKRDHPKRIAKVCAVKESNRQTQSCRPNVVCVVLCVECRELRRGAKWWWAGLLLEIAREGFEKMEM